MAVGSLLCGLACLVRARHGGFLELCYVEHELMMIYMSLRVYI